MRNGADGGHADGLDLERATGGESGAVRTLSTSPVPVRGAMVPAPWAQGTTSRSSVHRTAQTDPVRDRSRRVGPTVVGPDRYETPIPSRASGIVWSRPDQLEGP